MTEGGYSDSFGRRLFTRYLVRSRDNSENKSLRCTFQLLPAWPFIYLHWLALLCFVFFRWVRGGGERESGAEADIFRLVVSHFFILAASCFFLPFFLLPSYPSACVGASLTRAAVRSFPAVFSFFQARRRKGGGGLAG